MIFGLILLGSFVVNDTEDILTLQKNGDVELTINGNSESTHYLEPLVVNVQNKTKKIIEMKVPAGLHFVSNEENIQDIISTQAQLVRIAPNSNKHFTISGVCIQSTNGSPGLENEFKTVPGVQAPELGPEPEPMMEPQGQPPQGQPPQGNDDDDVLFGDAPEQRTKKVGYY